MSYAKGLDLTDTFLKTKNKKQKNYENDTKQPIHLRHYESSD